jgi:hypothetical protein
VLDELGALIGNSETREATMHTALATDLWIFGPTFALNVIKSKRTSILGQYAEPVARGRFRERYL